MLAACGRSAVSNEAVGQVKKVVDKTPLICSDYTMADISLGIMRDGTGSMSKEDLWVIVEKPEQRIMLKEAARTGELVEITYDSYRPLTWTQFCRDEHVLITVTAAR